MSTTIPKIINFLTFDIEEWYHANYKSVDCNDYKNSSSNLEHQIERLLILCNQYKVKATFFIVSSVAEKHPGSIKQISRQGHEIASHGHSHQLVYKMSPKKFKEDLKKSCSILENLTGKKILGFRAPSWSVNAKILPRFYQILEVVGLKYSSSVFPIKTYLFGIPDFPPKIHRPVTNVLEFPASIITIPFLNKNIGFSGGAFFRFIPYPILKNLIARNNNQKIPVIIYLHPREIDINQPRLNLSFKEKLIHYYGVTGCYNKLENCIKDFSTTFIPIRSALKYFTQHNESE